MSLNGVIQQPVDSTTHSTGFGIDHTGTIIFSTAPASTDNFWGHVLASNTVTFDISDNTIDSFTGTGSAVNFTLSKIPPDNRNILVTLDGVVQYPSTHLDLAHTLRVHWRFRWFFLIGNVIVRLFSPLSACCHQEGIPCPKGFVTQIRRIPQ